MPFALDVPGGVERKMLGTATDLPPRRAPLIPSSQPLISYLIQPVLLLHADAQWGVAFKVVDARFDPPVPGRQFSGAFAVDNIGPGYRVADLSVRPPSFALFIYRDDQLLFRDLGTWAAKEHAHGYKVHVDWQTRAKAAKIPFLVVPGPGRYRCRVELYAGNDHQRLIDDWEATVDVR
jgi:hypothetical protein